MKRLNFCYLFLIAFTCFAIACKKDKNNSKQADCRLKTLLEERTGGNTSWEFTYNNEGKVTSISTTNIAGLAIKDFSYQGATIISPSRTGGLFNYKDSITLDTKGRPLNIKRYYNETRTTWENIALEYNGEEISKVHKSNSSSPTPVTSVATYSNGNLVSLQSTTNTVTYDYFPEKAQIGDYLNLRGMTEYGFGIYPHQSLFKNSSSGGGTTTAVYEKNSDGLIVKATVIAGGNELKYSYQYECK